MIQSNFFKFPPNYMPITKTPWGGTQIVELKKNYAIHQKHILPERIGESYEGHHEHLLLKWIDAIEPLSIQVHPNNSNPFLSSNECGKPEAWFIYELANPSPVYLGFKEGYTQNQIIDCLKSRDPLECLHAFIPQKYDYISIPTGCVHALGAGILIAEPQGIIPYKEGKTWRIFDWNRLYNSKGIKDKNGMPRQLHVEESLSAIDWSLPRGQQLEELLVKPLKNKTRFCGNAQNPFGVEVFLQEGEFRFESLVPNCFSFITVFDGEVCLSNNYTQLHLHGGETGFIPADVHNTTLKIRKIFQRNVCVLIFAVSYERLLNNE